MPEVIDEDLVHRTLRRLKLSEKGGKKRTSLAGIKNSTLEEIRSILRRKEMIGSQGKKRLKEEDAAKFFACEECKSGINITGLEEEIAEIKKRLENRPAPNKQLDQKPLLAEHTVMRAAAIFEKDRLFDKRILCVGDYDSASIALSVLAKPKEITVVDIDERLLDFLETQAEEHGYPITVEHRDLSTPLPPHFRNAYDIFVADPPYAIGGMKTFIQRCINALKKSGTGYVAVPFHDNLPWSREMMRRIQRLVLEEGLLISDILKHFFSYQNADGLNSSLVRLCKAPNADVSDKQSFYWWDEDRPKENSPEVRL